MIEYILILLAFYSILKVQDICYTVPYTIAPLFNTGYPSRSSRFGELMYVTANTSALLVTACMYWNNLPAYWLLAVNTLQCIIFLLIPSIRGEHCHYNGMEVSGLVFVSYQYWRTGWYGYVYAASTIMVIPFVFEAAIAYRHFNKRNGNHPVYMG
jgi:hypothetical protein